jgi:hypothetical protein
MNQQFAFVLHVGVPRYQTESAQLLWQKELHDDAWEASPVSDVYSDPHLVEPYTVPGTLGFLLWRRFEDGNRQVLSEGISRCLRLFRAYGISDARLTVGFVTAWLESEINPDGTISREESRASQIEEPDWSILDPQEGSKLFDVPPWAMHIRLDCPTGELLSSFEVIRQLAKFNIRVQQAIKCESHVTEYEARSKLFCSVYYTKHEEAMQEAYRLFETTRALEEFAVTGHRTAVLLERI